MANIKKLSSLEAEECHSLSWSREREGILSQKQTNKKTRKKALITTTTWSVSSPAGKQQMGAGMLLSQQYLKGRGFQS